MQLGAKRAVDARATLLLGRGWCKTQNAHEARPRPSFRGQKAVSHVVWTQIPSTVLPPGQMAKCENCDSVHWQRQQSSIQVREPETWVEKVKRKWLQRTGPQVWLVLKLSSLRNVHRTAPAPRHSKPEVLLPSNERTRRVFLPINAMSLLCKKIHFHLGQFQSTENVVASLHFFGRCILVLRHFFISIFDSFKWVLKRFRVAFCLLCVKKQFACSFCPFIFLALASVPQFAEFLICDLLLISPCVCVSPAEVEKSTRGPEKMSRVRKKIWSSLQDVSGQGKDCSK